MQYKVDFDIENFEFWGEAKDVFDRCVQEDKLEELERLIEDTFCGSVPSEIQINDFVSFVSFDGEDLIFENDDCDECDE